MSPNIDAIKKYLYGIPTKGDPKFTNQLGINGVSLKNSMYQNKLCLFFCTIELNLENSAGNLRRTRPLAKVKLIKKHNEAPRQEH